MVFFPIISKGRHLLYLGNSRYIVLINDVYFPTDPLVHIFYIKTIKNSPAFSQYHLKDLPEIDTLKDDPSYSSPTLKPLAPDSVDEEEEHEAKKRPRDSSGAGYFRIDLGGGKIYHVKKYSHDQKTKLRNKIKKYLI